MKWTNKLLAWSAAGAALAACGCSPSRGTAVPHQWQDQAIVCDMSPEIRSWGVEFNPAFMDSLNRSTALELDHLARQGHRGPLPPAEYLAVSGGGANGAFGAGLLCAWSDSGTRPAFKVVTGISTGALTAPFVFAGSKYDSVLREVYTRTTTRDILIQRGLLQGFFGDAMADTSPLWELLSKYVNQEFLDDIAAEHAKGRLLIIGTTNLDSGRAVLWNVGAIAASGSPCALELVRKILIASAAIPGAFPPVFIEVQANGQTYEEMHVDGGAMTQVFLYPPTLQLKRDAAAAGIVRERKAYIIRNARLDSQWASVNRQTMSIVTRAINSLIQTQGVGDLYRIYANAKRDEIDFNLAYIPPDFDVPSNEPFDPVYMQALFQRGYDMARQGYPWQKSPPAFEAGIEGK